MKRFSSVSLLTSVLLAAPLGAAANSTLWNDVTTPIVSPHAKQTIQASAARYVDTNVAALTQMLEGETVSLELPLPDGSFATYQLSYTPVTAPELAAKYPAIRTFRGVDVNDPRNRGRFDITPQGFHGMFKHNDEWVMIDPSNIATERHMAYYSKHAKALNRRSADQYFKDTASLANDTQALEKTVAGDQLITYRMAISAAGEYTQFHGGTKVGGLGAVVTLLNRINEVYERELLVQFELVADNDRVIFTNANSDPFANDDSDVETNAGVLDSFIGTSNYDIGHVLNTQGGGLAYFGVCSPQLKGRGMSGSPFPSGDFFYVDLVAHEIGHQLGANHSFNGSSGSCGSNRNDGTAWEPGSGSTIMSYAGICADQDLQQTADPFFHSKSVEEMMDFISSRSCGTRTNVLNTPPTAYAGVDYTIPANTPFMLEGTGSDVNPTPALSYQWEQIDSGAASTDSLDMVDDGTRTLFRSWAPTSDKTRYFPRLSDLVSRTSTLGETLPTTTRALNFRFTVRDNAGGVASDDARINVTNQAGPFRLLTAHNSNYQPGATMEVRWDVAGTSDAPVNCSAVDILLSNSNATAFNTVLLSGTPNDGSESVTLPNQAVSNARVMVRCVNNIFFNISQGALSISTSTTTDPTTPTTPTTPTDPTTPDSSSGGGGNLPPWTLLLLALSGLVLSGCKGNTKPNDERFDADLTWVDDADAKADAAAAIAKKDYRLLAFSGRRQTLPGIHSDLVEQAKSQCGYLLVPGTGDALNSVEKGERRAKAFDYAKAFNQFVLANCKEAAQ